MARVAYTVEVTHLLRYNALWKRVAPLEGPADHETSMLIGYIREDAETEAKARRSGVAHPIM
jgi:hypothetical protein